jgi:hypothetical protein
MVSDLVAWMTGVPLAVVGIFVLVAADTTPRAISGAAALLAGVVLVSTAMLLGAIGRR